MEILESQEVPENLKPLFDAPSEPEVISEARKLIKSADRQGQESLLANPWFLSIVNQAMLGMDEARRDSLLDIVNSFAVDLRAEVFSRFSTLLDRTLY